MNLNFDLERFIREKVTKRERSLLADDFARYDAELHARLDGRRVLVIGGAGSIGSHYIKALLGFDVTKLVVVDISEKNGKTLAEAPRDGALAQTQVYSTQDAGAEREVQRIISANLGHVVRAGQGAAVTAH